MNQLTKTLLGGVALGALGACPSMAQQKHPASSLTAMHAGRVVNKTQLGRPEYHCLTHIHASCTFEIYTDVPASDLRKTVPLAGTFFRWNSYSTLCSHPKQHIRAWKKSTYAKITTGTQTYSVGCPSGPTEFYGDFYKLTDKSGFGKSDFFESELTGKFRNHYGKYKGRLIIAATVTIGTE